MKRAPRTHCAEGHALDEVNGYRTPAGALRCRICLKAQAALMRACSAAKRPRRFVPKRPRFISAITPVQLADCRRLLALELERGVG